MKLTKQEKEITIPREWLEGLIKRANNVETAYKRRQAEPLAFEGYTNQLFGYISSAEFILNKKK